GYNLGYEFEGAFETNRFIYSLVLGYALAEKWGIFMETYTNKTGKNPFDVRADAGITWLLFPNFQLDLSGGLGISKISPIGFISAGLSWRIPR
ncbi:MAG: transporter, partial [Bacteroidales bacterium]|nr:transporter [Bacteroidales bacterium]